MPGGGEGSMHYYRDLYLDSALRKKKDRVIQRIEDGKLQADIFLVVLASGARNQLEIIDTLFLAQPDYPKRDWYVVGLAKGHDRAVELVKAIVSEVYQNTGNADVRSYFRERGIWT